MAFQSELGMVIASSRFYVLCTYRLRPEAAQRLTYKCQFEAGTIWRCGGQRRFQRARDGLQRCL